MDLSSKASVFLSKPPSMNLHGIPYNTASDLEIYFVGN